MSLLVLLLSLAPVAIPSVAQERAAASPVASAQAQDAPLSAVTRAIALQGRIQEVHAVAMRTTVAIFGRAGNGRPRGSGASGVLVSADGLVLTAAHVLESVGDRPLVRMPGGRLVDAVSLGRDDRADFGLLRLEFEGDEEFPFAEMGVSGELVQDEVCLMYGHPGGVVRGRPAVLRLGVFLDRRRDGMLRTTCKMMPGDSGGPVFDLEGRVVAINSQINVALDRNYHVPVDPARAQWDRLLAGEQWSSERVGRNAPRPPAPERVESDAALPGGVDALREAFAAAAADLHASVVRLEEEGGALLGYGIAVDDGQVLAKSTRVPAGPVRARFADGDAVEARVLARDRASDLVLVEVTGLACTPVGWSNDSPPTGALLATVGAAADVLQVGAVGAPDREVPQRDYGVLGVRFDRDEDDDRIEVEAAFEGAPAFTAGVREGDVVVAFQGDAFTSGNALREVLRRTEPGERVTMTVEGPDGEARTLEFALGSSSRLQAMSGNRTHAAYRTETSLRRGGFPSVLNHDMPLEPSECGGPVVDLEGRVVGLNIARHDRTASFALPAAEVRRVLARLRAAAAAAE